MISPKSGLSAGSAHVRRSRLATVKLVFSGICNRSLPHPTAPTTCATALSQLSACKMCPSACHSGLQCTCGMSLCSCEAAASIADHMEHELFGYVKRGRGEGTHLHGAHVHPRHLSSENFPEHHSIAVDVALLIVPLHPRTIFNQPLHAAQCAHKISTDSLYDRGTHKVCMQYPSQVYLEPDILTPACMQQAILVSLMGLLVRPGGLAE